MLARAVVVCDQRQNALCKSQSGIKSDHIHFFGYTHTGDCRAAVLCHKLVCEDVGNHGKEGLQSGRCADREDFPGNSLSEGKIRRRERKHRIIAVSVEVDNKIR